MNISPVKPVKDAVSASFRAKVGPPGNLKLGELERSDGVLGAVVPLVRRLDGTLQVPEISVTPPKKKTRLRKGYCRWLIHDESCPCVSWPAVHAIRSPAAHKSGRDIPPLRRATDSNRRQWYTGHGQRLQRARCCLHYTRNTSDRGADFLPACRNTKHAGYGQRGANIRSCRLEIIRASNILKIKRTWTRGSAETSAGLSWGVGTAATCRGTAGAPS